MTGNTEPAKAGVNHKRNGARFLIVVFWLAIIGLAYTAVANSANWYAISWATYLFYLVVAVPVLYAGFYLSKHFWRNA